MITWANMSKTLDCKYASITYRMLQDELTYGQYSTNMSPALHTTRRFEYPWVYDTLDLQPSDRILDVASGVTFFPMQLARESAIVVCVDNDPEVVSDIIKTNQCNNIVARLGDATKLEYNEKSFDKVICISALEHMTNMKSAIDEMLRLSLGKVLITMDVILEGEGVLTYDKLKQLMAEYNMEVPKLPYDAILVRDRGTLFGVACVEMERK